MIGGSPAAVCAENQACRAKEGGDAPPPHHSAQGGQALPDRCPVAPGCGEAERAAGKEERPGTEAPGRIAVPRGTRVKGPEP
jgi:hypothetical protein